MKVTSIALVSAVAVSLAVSDPSIHHESDTRKITGSGERLYTRASHDHSKPLGNGPDDCDFSHMVIYDIGEFTSHPQYLACKEKAATKGNNNGQTKEKPQVEAKPASAQPPSLNVTPLGSSAKKMADQLETLGKRLPIVEAGELTADFSSFPSLSKALTDLLTAIKKTPEYADDDMDLGTKVWDAERQLMYIKFLGEENCKAGQTEYCV